VKSLQLSWALSQGAFIFFQTSLAALPFLLQPWFLINSLSFIWKWQNETIKKYLIEKWKIQSNTCFLIHIIFKDISQISWKIFSPSHLEKKELQNRRPKMLFNGPGLFYSLAYNSSHNFANQQRWHLRPLKNICLYMVPSARIPKKPKSFNLA